MKFRIVRFIVGIVGLIVIIQVLTAIYFSSKHWPEDHLVIGSRHVGRSSRKTPGQHVDEQQVSEKQTKYSIILLRDLFSFPLARRAQFKRLILLDLSLRF